MNLKNLFASHKLGEYTRLPDALKLKMPEISEIEKPDVFGLEDRLIALRHVWPSFANATSGGAIDLGGNSGFFSLSLVAEGLLTESTVYDANPAALEAGRQMAEMMGLSDKVRFVEQQISLEWLRSLEPVDNVICLNLIHHAGALFDIEEVNERGWQSYANDWLIELRRISKRCIFGVGFKGSKPVNWDVNKQERPRVMLQMAKAQGWNPLYDANVQDIADFGADQANGLRSSGAASAVNDDKRKPKVLAWVNKLTRKWNKSGPDKQRPVSKRNKYHLIILE